MGSESPWRQTTWFPHTWAVSLEEGNWVQGRKWAIFMRWSMIVKMVIGPLDSGSFMMKSGKMVAQDWVEFPEIGGAHRFVVGHLSAGTYVTGGYLCCIVACMQGHQKKRSARCWVLEQPKCPAGGQSWHIHRTIKWGQLERTYMCPFTKVKPSQISCTSRSMAS